MTFELRTTGPKRGAPRLVLAHGAGAPMDSAFMAAIADGLAGAKVQVIRFEFPYMAERRTTGKKKPPNGANKLQEAYREVLAQIGSPARTVIGGKSMGGRIASMIADEVGVRGLCCLGYPFHPPGKPETLRTAHLETLQTPALILQGERDPFGTAEDVSTYTLSSAIQCTWLPDGDHSFKPRVRSGHTLEGNLQAAVSAMATFLHAL